MARSDRARRENLNERVQQDVVRGDLGMARTRLLSLLQQQGYSADLLARIGRISFDMHDLANAGMYWLVSNALGPEVDAAIQAFADRCGGIAGNMVTQLPQFLRRMPLARYPAEVQARLGRFGIDERYLASGASESGRGHDYVRTRRDKALDIFIGACFLAAVVSMIVGLDTIIRWLF